MKEFYLKTGELSPYALACGYIESVWIDSVHITLWREHNAYHVEACDFEGKGILSWDVFDSLSPARKRFRQVVKEIKREYTS